MLKRKNNAWNRVEFFSKEVMMIKLLEYYVRSRVCFQGNCGQEYIKLRGRERCVACDWVGLQILGCHDNSCVISGCYGYQEFLQK